MTANDIIRLETDFWQKLIDKDLEGSSALITQDCVTATPRGVIMLNPTAFADRARWDNWSLDRFELHDIIVTMPNDDTAIIAYRVVQTGRFDDNEMSLECADSSTWVRHAGSWKCAAHTESVLA